MKKLFILMLLAGLLTGCSDDEPQAVAPTATGTMEDQDGNTYRWVRIDTLDWMAENMKGGTRWFDQNRQRFSVGNLNEDEQLFDVFGNYYTYSEALALCPDGWRLPTDDDWKCLERACGMKAAETDQTGWRGNIREQLTDPAAIGLRYGGELAATTTTWIGKYHVYDYAIYWSATVDESSVQRSAYIRKLTPAMDGVQRVAAPTGTRWYSVRYVRRATQ